MKMSLDLPTNFNRLKKNAMSWSTVSRRFKIRNKTFARRLTIRLVWFFEKQINEDQKEQELKMAKQVADEAERKYEEISRKLAMVEHDLERAEDLGDNNSSKLKAAEVEISRLTEGKGLFYQD